MRTASAYIAGVKAGQRSRRHAKGPTASSVGALLKQWREQRRMSQLDLAVEAEISTRHLSFLGTPYDITLHKLRIECFFAADRATEEALRRLA